MLSALLAVMAPVWADVFVMRDESGVIHYTNTPSGMGYTLLVEVVREIGLDNQATVQPRPEAAPAYAPYVADAASEVGVDRALIHAVITAESGYNASAVSRAGAMGLMQLMPGTAKRYRVVDAYDPEQNIRGGARYLRDLLEMFDGDVALALAAYNAGENAVLKYGRQVPPYKETRAYVPKVLKLYDRYAALGL